MQTIFKLFSLTETQIITGSWLSSGGIKNEYESVIVRTHLADFDSESDAILFVNEQSTATEHGYEIVKTLNFINK